MPPHSCLWHTGACTQQTHSDLNLSTRARARLGYGQPDWWMKSHTSCWGRGREHLRQNGVFRSEDPLPLAHPAGRGRRRRRRRVSPLTTHNRQTASLDVALQSVPASVAAFLRSSALLPLASTAALPLHCLSLHWLRLLHFIFFTASPVNSLCDP